MAECKLRIRYALAVPLAGLLAATLAAQAQNPQIDAHVAAAKAAVGRDHQVLFTSLCSAEPTGPGTGRRGAAPQPGAAPAPPPGPPPRPRRAGCRGRSAPPNKAR